jgi:hypothetical protein
MADEVGGICHKWDICYDNELEMLAPFHRVDVCLLFVLSPFGLAAEP